MAPRTMVPPAFALPRSIALLASFAGCGVLLAMLFLVLVGCALVAGLNVDYSSPANPNAVLCSCICDGAVATENPVRAGNDDAAQAPGQKVALTAPTLTLGQGNSVGFRFQKLGVPPKATITSAFIQFSAAQADSGTTDLDIFAVNLANAGAFTAATDLTLLPTIGPVHWVPLAWATRN